MKAMILSLNSKYIHSSLAPWYLKAAAEEYNDKAVIRVYESTINRTVNETFAEIKDYKPQLLACSCYIWNIEKILRLAEMYKAENPEAYIVLGGPEVGYRAEQVLREYSFVDAVISGEGERPFSLLYGQLSVGKGLGNIEGVSYKSDNKLILNGPYITTEEPPSPYSSEFFQQLADRIVYIEGSRGCPFSCAFCLSGRCGTVRYFGLDRIKNDIIRVANSGAKIIKFVDRTFNAHKKRAMDIWSFIIENSDKRIPHGVCFHFEIAGDLLDSESLELLKTAPKGLIQVEIGLQSFNPKTLESINRKTDADRLCGNIKKLVEYGNIHTHIDLIAGLPFEDMASFKDSFNKAFYLGADNLQLGFLKLLHGAPMRDNPEKYPCEFSPIPPYEVTETPWLNGEEIAALKNTEDAVERIYNSGRFPKTLDYLIAELGLNPFHLFYDIGNALGNVEKISLNQYLVKLYNRLSVYEQTDSKIVRDLLVADKLFCDPSGYVPMELRLRDPLLKKAKNYFRSISGGEGKRLGVGINYSAEIPYAYCVDYSQRQEDGNYRLLILKLRDVSDL